MGSKRILTLKNLRGSGQVQKKATMPQCGLTTPGSRAGRRKLSAFLDKIPTAVKNLAGITEIWIPPYWMGLCNRFLSACRRACGARREP